MKKLAIVVAIAVIANLCAFAYAMAADEIMSFKATSVVNAKDKNGNPYTRVIAEVQAQLNGVSYTKGVPVMFFSPAADKASAIKNGQTVKAIVQKGEYRGRDSYQGVAVLEVK